MAKVKDNSIADSNRVVGKELKHFFDAIESCKRDKKAMDKIEQITDWLDFEILDAQTNIKLDPQFSKQYTGMVMALKSTKQFIATLPELPKD